MVSNRYEFIILFDVENGNPNGDPDAGNCPRFDPETNFGLVTDVCQKAKIRSYVQLAKAGEEGFNILIKPEKTLDERFKEAYQACGFEPDKNDKGSKKNEVQAAREYMCRNYYDVRTFGAVMSTGKSPCGVLRGPVQIGFAKSISPILPMEITITRQARTNEERKKSGDTEMGVKYIIPYALYRAEGTVSAPLAKKSGFSEEDLELLWEAILNMFEHDHSASRGKMAVRALYVFKHATELGCCPASVLFDKVKVAEKHPGTPARAFEDYEVTIDENMPDGVEFIDKSWR